MLAVRRALASWFWLGFVPRRVWGHDAGAGTVGGLGALALGLALAPLGVGAQALALAVIIGAGLWAMHPFTADHSDPRWIAVDEAAGTLLALLGLDLVPALVGFAVFRAADIPKRFPLVNRAQSLPGAVGVLADDLVAGAWGLAAGWSVQLILRATLGA